MAAAIAPKLTDLELFLKQDEETELLRFSTAGSVDDGKSTLIGRLLYDSKGVYEDQLASARRVTRNREPGELDLSLLTDGLRAEREQGITIDVAYRYFSTPRRKFIIADTPGHEQYTRNMATGASTADLAIILVDARSGVLQQSRRHASIATLLGIPHLVVAVNKMDLVDFSEDVFERIRRDFTAFAAQLNVRDLLFIPISALLGDNVVDRSSKTPWYEGPALLEHLETVPIARDRNMQHFRFAVQYVIRPNQDFRGFAGQIASGVVRPGDEITALPSGRTSRVRSITTYDGDLPAAFPPMSVTLTLEDELDISRGDMLVHAGNPPWSARRFAANIVWMSEKPLLAGRPYLLKHTTQQVRAAVRRISHRVDVNTLEHAPVTELRLNEIGVAELETNRLLFFDAYGRNRATGSFILIDPITNETAGAGMILAGPQGAPGIPSPDLSSSDNSADYSAQPSGVSAADRSLRFGHQAAVIWFRGSGAALEALEQRLFTLGLVTAALKNLGSPAELAATARALYDAGLIVLLSDEAGRELSSASTSGLPAAITVHEAEGLPASGAGEEDPLVEVLRSAGVLE